MWFGICCFFYRIESHTNTHKHAALRQNAQTGAFAVTHTRGVPSRRVASTATCCWQRLTGRCERGGVGGVAHLDYVPKNTNGRPRRQPARAEKDVRAHHTECRSVCAGAISRGRQIPGTRYKINNGISLKMKCSHNMSFINFYLRRKINISISLTD